MDSYKKELEKLKKRTLQSLQTYKSPSYHKDFSNKRKAFGGLEFKPKAFKCSWKGVSFDSKAEAVFYIYKKEILKSSIERNKTRYLLYQDPTGQTFKFYPDFVDCGSFVEIKGIVSSLDKCKRDQHPEVTWLVLSEQADLFAKMEKELDQKLPNWKKELKNG